MVRLASGPSSADETAPTKVNAMNKPKHISDTRSTTSSTGSRASSPPEGEADAPAAGTPAWGNGFRGLDILAMTGSTTTAIDG
ncbi:hypothetical protein ADE_00730 [Achromobacter denitrificans]|nr:hypothetical protein ADE_00730 [Achromobacter denitrificans]